MTDLETSKSAELTLPKRRALPGAGLLARRALCLTGAALALSVLPGCQNITGNPSLSQLRIIDASPDAPGIDIYENNAVLAYNLGLGTITSYVPIVPGVYNIAVDAAGTRTQLTTSRASLATNGQYTVLVGDNLASLGETVLQDQTTPAPSGQISLRVVDQSTRAGSVDLYLIPTGLTITNVRPILQSVSFGTNTGYFDVPAGTYTLAALPAGTVPTSTTTSSYTGASVSYSGGSARTFVLIDQQLITTPGLQVVVADDYDPATATS